MQEVKALEESVNNFQGRKADKEYKYLEEMLTRSLLKLDSVEAEGHDNIRQARKNSVRLIEAALDLLELKACANEQQVPATPASTIPTNTSNHATESSMETAMESAGVIPPARGGSGEKGNGPTPSHVKEMVLDSEVSC